MTILKNVFELGTLLAALSCWAGFTAAQLPQVYQQDRLVCDCPGGQFAPVGQCVTIASNACFALSKIYKGNKHYMTFPQVYVPESTIGSINYDTHIWLDDKCTVPAAGTSIYYANTVGGCVAYTSLGKNINLVLKKVPYPPPGFVNLVNSLIPCNDAQVACTNGYKPDPKTCGGMRCKYGATWNTKLACDTKTCCYNPGSQASCLSVDCGKKKRSTKACKLWQGSDGACCSDYCCQK